MCPQYVCEVPANAPKVCMQLKLVQTKWYHVHPDVPSILQVDNHCHFKALSIV